jgi:hypothetical protein
MTMTAVFGEFLSPAGEHIAAASRFGGEMPPDAKRSIITELDCLVTTLAHYLGDLALPDDFSPASTANPEVRAALDARTALRRAAASMHSGATAVRETTADDAHPAVRHLSAANGYLAAGRDLLQTHFTPGSAGIPTGSSPWAAAIISWPVTAALISELAACARHLGLWAAQLSETGSMYAGVPAEACLALHTAGQWLQLAGTSMQVAQLNQPLTSVGHELLAAIPPNIPPPRQPPSDAEPVPELCEGITTSAERLRHAALAFARQSRWSPAASSTSWRRDALASAITSHASEFVLRGLAERARQLGCSGPIQAQLASAADAMSQSWPAWRTIACQWDIVSTGNHHDRAVSPVAAEFDDLVVRTGRLAYRNSRWTPACAAASVTRDPADLAATASDIRTVLAAVHHAADAISRVAASDREAVRAAAADHRLYLPTRLLPENYDIPCRYSPVPPPLADELADAYDTAIDTSLRAAIALDDLATTTIDAPSSTLAAIRALASASAHQAATEEASAPGQAQPLQPRHTLPAHAGQVERILRDLKITEPAMLLRAAAIDQAARDMLTQATVNSRQRHNLSPLPQRQTQQAPGSPAMVAARDLPRAPEQERPASPRPKASVVDDQPGRRSQMVPPSLHRHSAAN